MSDSNSTYSDITVTTVKWRFPGEDEPPSTAAQLLPIDPDDRHGQAVAMESTREDWDTPEEHEAWRHLQ